MEAIKYIYWQNEEMWLGYLEEYPDYWTQGETREELEENLRDIYLSKCQAMNPGRQPVGGVDHDRF